MAFATITLPEVDLDIGLLSDGRAVVEYYSVPRERSTGFSGSTEILSIEVIWAEIVSEWGDIAVIHPAGEVLDEILSKLDERYVVGEICNG
jgi:hypothetical protein